MKRPTKRASNRSRTRLWLESLEPRQLLAVYAVTTTADGGEGSLREAIRLANEREDTDTIVFADELSGAKFLLDNGALEIRQPLVIDASALRERPVIDAQHKSRAFAFFPPLSVDYDFGFVWQDGRLVISNLVIDNGRATRPNTLFQYAQLCGGAILGSGNLEIIDSVISGSIASCGGAIEMLGGHLSLERTRVVDNETLSPNGFAIDAPWVYERYESRMTLTNSVVTGNRSGGVCSCGYRGRVSLSGSQVANNQGDGVVGALTASVADSFVVGNQGDGLKAQYSAAVAIRSFISGNSGIGVVADGAYQSTVQDSTISANLLGLGGYSFDVTRSTISGNRLGGIDAGSVTMTQSTVSGNGTIGETESIGGITAERVRMTQSTVFQNAGDSSGGVSTAHLSAEGSIIAENQAVSNPDLLALESRFSPTSIQIRNSLIGDNAGIDLVESQVPDGMGNLIGSASGGGVIDPKLTALGDFGGSTMVHMLRTSSPAIDAVDLEETTETDQRGLEFIRLADGDGNGVARHDMGSVERQAVSNDGDFDRNGIWNCSDIDALMSELGGSEQVDVFDMNDDGLIDVRDRDVWLAQAGLENLRSGLPYLLGDVNLDGRVTSLDLGQLELNWQQPASGWCAGDMDGNRIVTAIDLNLIGANWQSDVSGENAVWKIRRIRNEHKPQWRATAPGLRLASDQPSKIVSDDRVRRNFENPNWPNPKREDLWVRNMTADLSISVDETDGVLGNGRSGPDRVNRQGNRQQTTGRRQK